VTICASVKVRDGLVLATDSMTQIQAKLESGDVQVIKAYSNARKLFQLAQFPIGIMSWGLGNIGNRSIAGVVRDFAGAHTEEHVEAAAKALSDHVRVLYEEEFKEIPEQERPGLGFMVAGYSPGSAFAEEWEIVFPVRPEPAMVRSQEIFGSAWRGIRIPFTRLYFGFDPRLEDFLQEAGFAQDQAQAIMKVALEKLGTAVVYDGMPVQDAINFAAFIVNTTVGASTFEIGVPSCGGPLQLAAILPGDGFTWIERPALSLGESR
jgi:hypothetical protein